MVPSVIPLALIVMLSVSGGAFFYSEDHTATNTTISILDPVTKFINKTVSKVTNTAEDFFESMWDFLVKKIIGGLTSVLNWFAGKLRSVKTWIDDTLFPEREDNPTDLGGMTLFLIFNVIMVLVWFFMVRSFLWIADLWIWILDVLPIV